MPLHHLTGIQASTSICGSMCSQLISFSELICGSAGLMLMSWELWLMLCRESCRFTGNGPSWLNNTSFLARHERIVYFSQWLDDVIPSVQSWSMALMMRSHSSARVRQPHSPSNGTYSSSFCSASTSGTLMPNSSGNVAAQGAIVREPMF